MMECHDDCSYRRLEYFALRYAPDVNLHYLSLLFTTTTVATQYQITILGWPKILMLEEMQKRRTKFKPEPKQVVFISLRGFDLFATLLFSSWSSAKSQP
ncbi:unnamed protein product [Callosobruchus maculatus]|uniref:Uncharacterized protein n=1 Tax=Callosobruchus maculatus TaxID=64391 RepID=A0A653BPJ7_CALMS|nr:unnamed protein product [Callosobruchus maculatus]